ncbi:glycosyltransferase family 76 protein [Pisolithus croceorrhizus]|nr:glycosyltransferase family 76 protein [Pisolithus croceorrhizus]KAI6135768.1 glycosyltransferase family 76 protein [Pisolithus croceorrhizus]
MLVRRFLLSPVFAMKAAPVASDHHSQSLLAQSLLSRLLICLLIVSSAALLTLFDTSPKLILDDSASVWTSSLLRWDVFHFAHMAREGLVYEHEWAFFPGIALVMRWSGSVLSLLGLSPPGWPGLLIGGAIVAALSDSTRVLYQLSLYHLHSSSAAFLATVLSFFSTSPSALRFAPYSEPFFTYFSYRGMLACARSQWLRASLYFAVAGVFRSNAVLLCGFIMWDMLVAPLLSGRKDLFSLKTTLRCVAYVVVSLLPFIHHNYRAYLLFCSSTRVHDRSQWCERGMLPSIYTHVQREYWNVGFLRYWTISNIPNFLISLPVLLSVWIFCIFYLSHLPRILRDGFARQGSKSSAHLPLGDSLFLNPSILPHVLHGISLTLILTFNAHVQIALRVLPSLPMTYWAAARLLIEQPRWGKAWVAWSMVWCGLSCVLWAVFLPPA